MKCHILFSRENKKNITRLSSAEIFRLHAVGTRYTWNIFYHFHKGDNFYDFLFAFLQTKSFLKRGLLLQGKQIPFFRSILSQRRQINFVCLC